MLVALAQVPQRVALGRKCSTTSVDRVDGEEETHDGTGENVPPVVSVICYPCQSTEDEPDERETLQ